MSRRVNLPAADDLFRSTRPGEPREREAQPRRPAPVSDISAKTAPAPEEEAGAESGPQPATRRTSGRVRHDEKMTVYVTSDELLDLEHTRLALRRDAGLAVDRGRLVRVAIAMALADFEEHGVDSDLVRRLNQR